MSQNPYTKAIKYTTGGAELLLDIQPLWEELRIYHSQKSLPFRQEFINRDFDSRRDVLLCKAGRGMLVELAADSASSEYIAYCVSTIDNNGRGEIDSLFVSQNYRRQGIGEQLVQRTLAWMEQAKTADIYIQVAGGNEEVLPFYASFGFQPRSITLKKNGSYSGGS